MPRRVSKRKPPADVNEAAFRVVALLTGDTPETKSTKPKNPAAVALGKLGGSKGGLARAANLSKTRRKAIAKRAAKARWGRAT
jgi:hypothetical protein